MVGVIFKKKFPGDKEPIVVGLALKGMGGETEICSAFAGSAPPPADTTRTAPAICAAPGFMFFT